MAKARRPANSRVEDLETFVGASYSSDAAQSFPTGVLTIVDFEDVEWDSHGLVTTGASWKFTAQKKGIYSVDVAIQWQDTSGWGSGSENSYIELFKNGVLYRRLDYWECQTAGITIAVGLSGSTDVELEVGDYIDIRAFQVSGSALTLSSNSGVNHVSIKREGSL